MGATIFIYRDLYFYKITFPEIILKTRLSKIWQPCKK